VHQLTGVKGAINNSSIKFFECKVQTSEDVAVHAVCYSPEKRLPLLQAFQKKSPVKIRGIKRKHDDNYQIPKTAQIKQKSSINIPYNESSATNLMDVKDVLTATVYQQVDMKVKVILKPETKHKVIVNGNTKYNVECLVTDEIGSMKLTLWEEAIDKVQAGKSYHFQNMKVRIFADEHYVNTNDSTTITPIGDIAHVDLKSLEMSNNLIVGQCLGVDIKRHLACIVCNATIEPLPEEESSTCNKCNMTILTEFLKPKLVCQLVIKAEDKLVSYTCFNNAIESFLKISNVEKPLPQLSLTELKNILLRGGQMRMIVDKSASLLVQFLQLGTPV